MRKRDTVIKIGIEKPKQDWRQKWKTAIAGKGVCLLGKAAVFADFYENCGYWKAEIDIEYQETKSFISHLFLLL